MPTVIKAQQGVAPNTKVKGKRNKNRSIFCGVPLVSILKVANGWQVQQRDDEESQAWVDVPKGLFKSKKEAEEKAPYLCEF